MKRNPAAGSAPPEAGAETAALEPTPANPLAVELAAVDGIGLLFDEPLARHTTFRIGGAAELLAEVESETALCHLRRAAARHRMACRVLGLGSNVLVPDEGLQGVVVKLGGALKAIEFDGPRVAAGAGVALTQLARRASSQGLVGLENLAGFPSTVGGAVVMNAGCYGSEIADVLLSVRLVDAAGEARELETAALEPGYRSTRLQGSDWIVTRADFELRPGDAAAALARIQELHGRRRGSLPSGHPNAGSVFKNPPGDYAGRLIDVCGLKGRRLGDAQISPKHGNVIVNLGAARADDVLGLMLEARRAVAERFAVDLEPEVVLAGSLAARWRSGGGG